jgi:hypothetical protein
MTAYGARDLIVMRMTMTVNEEDVEGPQMRNDVLMMEIATSQEDGRVSPTILLAYRIWMMIMPANAVRSNGATMLLMFEADAPSGMAPTGPPEPPPRVASI